ncbi:MAG TPA: ABC transporter permease [Coriobacteriia bacterium]
MSLYDLVHETFLALTNNKVRSSLTILGIVVGIASVILMVSIGQGSQSAITKSIQSAGSNLLMVTPGGGGFFSGERSGGGGSGGTRPTLTEKDVKAIKDLPGVAAIAPESSSQVQVSTAGASTNLRVTGVSGPYESVKAIETSNGSFLSEQDISGSTKVAVLGPTVVTDLFGEGADPVGQKIRINGMNFTVIGVTKSKGGTGFGNADEVVYIPLTTLQRFLSGSDSISTINIEAKTTDVMSTLQQAITDTLNISRNVKDPASPDFRVLSQSDILQTASTITGTFTVLLASIAGISLVVGGIGIMNMMLTTVTERTREIGLRKAIGARSTDITSQFLMEAVTLTVLGGAIGIALGWGASLLVTATGLMTTEVSWNAVALAVGVCAGIGIVFGYYPARRAAKLDPIEALRYQ